MAIKSIADNYQRTGFPYRTSNLSYLAILTFRSTLSVLTYFLHTNKDISMHGSRGWGVWKKNHKNIGFHTNTSPDPLKNHKATKLTFNVGPSYGLAGR